MHTPIKQSGPAEHMSDICRLSWVWLVSSWQASTWSIPASPVVLIEQPNSPPWVVNSASDAYNPPSRFRRRSRHGVYSTLPGSVERATHITHPSSLCGCCVTKFSRRLILSPHLAVVAGVLVSAPGKETEVVFLTIRMSHGIVRVHTAQ